MIEVVNFLVLLNNSVQVYTDDWLFTINADDVLVKVIATNRFKDLDYQHTYSVTEIESTMFLSVLVEAFTKELDHLS